MNQKRQTDIDKYNKEQRKIQKKTEDAKIKVMTTQVG